MSEIVIDVDGLSRRFGNLVAVDQVSFQVEGGAIFGLLGPNGSGKSTIIRMLLGILPPSGGSASVLGFDAQSQSELIKPRVGYMSQQFSLYGDLSVQENLEFYGRVYGLNRHRLAERRDDVVRLVGIGDRLGQLARTLSGGWKQRLALACSLIHEPQVLFLDEPTAGIDPVARRDLWDLLFTLSSRGVTLLVTTHYMDEAERCTDVAYIYLSRLLVLGKPHELKRLSEVTPPGMARFELKANRPTHRLATLRNHPHVRDATLFGESLHLLLDDPAAEAEIFQAIKQEDPAAQWRPADPTLEDVFVSLTRSAERRHTAASVHVNQPAERVTESVAPSSPIDRKATTPRRQITERRGSPIAAELNGWWAILVKEFFHIRRQPTTLFFMLVVPVLQTIIFGYAINTKVEHIPTVVWDLDGRTTATTLVESLENTRRFQILDRVRDESTFQHMLQSGRAKVGVIIPPDYSERLSLGEQALVQVLIDGSDSQVATTAQSTAQLLGQSLSLQYARTRDDALQIAPSRDPFGRAAMPVEIRTRLLYNPDLDSAHFFVPGLVGVILQVVTLFLTSFAIVREREIGTLEQLFVTPVGRSGLLLGKLVPYALVGFASVLIVVNVMIYLFGVPVSGSIPLLLSLALLFMVCSLSLGLLVSTLAKTQLEAVQLAFMIMLPSILLSGFVFPRDEMPLPIYLISFGIPATYFIEILRGIVLRGAQASDLLTPIAGLVVCCAIIAFAGITRFHKRLA